MMARRKNVNQARRSQHTAATKMEGAQPFASAEQGKLARTVATAALLHTLTHLSLTVRIILLKLILASKNVLSFGFAFGSRLD